VTRTTTIRLPTDQADELEAIARVDGMAFSEAIRQAVAAYITTRQADHAFQERLRRRVEADQHILERLADTDRGEMGP
jgi:predicted transcriptional regulator